MQRVFLIGYMGAGKSTMGRHLADVMGLTFIDLDAFIESRQRRTISEIFATDGEAAFRDMERSALREVATYDDVVVSLGGGTPCYYDNMDVVNGAGVSVYLKPSEDVLVQRLAKGKAKRPVIADKDDAELRDFIRQQLARREPYYRRAAITFESSHLENKADIRQNATRLAEEIRKD